MITRSIEQQLIDIRTAINHFNNLVYDCEEKAAQQHEQAACFRVKIDELRERLAKLDNAPRVYDEPR